VELKGKKKGGGKRSIFFAAGRCCMIREGKGEEGVAYVTKKTGLILDILSRLRRTTMGEGKKKKGDASVLYDWREGSGPIGFCQRQGGKKEGGTRVPAHTKE